MRDVVRASTPSGHTTTETPRRRLFVKASFKAMTRAIGNTPAMVMDATERVEVTAEAFLAEFLVVLE